MLKALMIAGDGQGTVFRSILTNLLKEGRLFEIAEDENAARTLEDRDRALDFDLFVVYGAAPVLSDRAQANFDGSLADGAGLLIVSGQPPAREWPLLARLAGAFVRPGSPEPRTQAHVHYLDHSHPVTRGLRDFEIVLPQRPWPSLESESVRILAAVDAEGAAAPAMVSASYGRGRVFHCMIAASELEENSMLAASEPLQRAVARAAEWAATGNVLDF